MHRARSGSPAAGQTCRRVTTTLQFIDLARARGFAARDHRAPEQADCRPARVERDDGESPSRSNYAKDAGEVARRVGANGRPAWDSSWKALNNISGHY